MSRKQGHHRGLALAYGGSGSQGNLLQVYDTIAFPSVFHQVLGARTAFPYRPVPVRFAVTNGRDNRAEKLRRAAPAPCRLSAFRGKLRGRVEIGRPFAHLKAPEDRRTNVVSPRDSPCASYLCVGPLGHWLPLLQDRLLIPSVNERLGFSSRLWNRSRAEDCGGDPRIQRKFGESEGNLRRPATGARLSQRCPVLLPGNRARWPANAGITSLAT